MDHDRVSALSQDVANAILLVYDELRRRARKLMRFEPKGHTLDPTALVHEVYLRLAERGLAPPESRAGLMRLASLTMRRLLIDRARRVRRGKRAGKHKHVDLAPDDIVAPGATFDPLEVDEALRALEEHDEEMAAVVTLHYFFGMTVAETAAALGQSDAKTKKDLAFARAWLRTSMGREDDAAV